jgi:hypothetical protein
MVDMNAQYLYQIANSIKTTKGIVRTPSRKLSSRLEIETKGRVRSADFEDEVRRRVVG